jgi:glutathione S-transferase
MSDAITLYDAPGSPCARRVRAVLLEKADLSVGPRVQMYPVVQISLEPARHPAVCAWLSRLAARPSFARIEAVRPG